jgi:hypothetical protein
VVRDWWRERVSGIDQAIIPLSETLTRYEVVTCAFYPGSSTARGDEPLGSIQHFHGLRVGMLGAIMDI